MIGLLFFGTIFLWLIFSIFLALRLPRWFNFKDRWGFVIAPMVFFLPVIDEVVALPQAYLLCQQAENEFWYDSSVKGGVMQFHGLHSEEKKIIGFNIEAKFDRNSEILKDTNKPVIKRTSIYFSAGFLGAFLDPSGKLVAILLPQRCPSMQWGREKYLNAVELLGLTSEPRPNF